eukprot:5242852-Pyramimonas_sp.AAC.1
MLLCVRCPWSAPWSAMICPEAMRAMRVWRFYVWLARSSSVISLPLQRSRALQRVPRRHASIFIAIARLLGEWM